MRKTFSVMLAFVLVLCGTFYCYGQVTVRANKEESVYARGGTPIDVKTDIISYSYTNEDEYVFPDKIPGYISNYTCGITAGGVIVGYYDRSYEDLIPNHTGSYLLGKWRWGTQGTEVNNMFSSLYTLMGATSSGVTVPGYKSGMTSYVASKGQTMSFTDVKATSGALNPAYKTALKAGKPLTIFLNGFNIVSFNGYLSYTDSGKYDKIVNEIYSGLHVMAVYGYLEVKYFNASNINFQTETFLYVCTGYTTNALAWLRLSAYCAIDDCYISHIS